MLRSFSWLVLTGLIVTVLIGCARSSEDVDVESSEYTEAVAAFYTGVAALQVGQDRHAEEKMLRVTEIYPDEPAAWANLGLLSLRRNEFDVAEERLDRAVDLAPEASRIRYLQGILSVARGNTDAAIEHLRESIRLDSSNVKAEYALIEQLEQRGLEEDASEIRRLVDAILRIDPNNLAVLIERARFAALAGDGAELTATLDSLSDRAEAWPEPAREQYAAARQAAAAGNMDEVITSLSFLNNILKREADYRESIATVRGTTDQSSELISEFLWLPDPVSRPATPDDSLSFAVEPLFRDRSAPDWTFAGAAVLSAEGLPVVIAASSDSLFFEDGSAIALPGPVAARGFIPLDFDYDFRVDLAFAGPDGFALLRQDADSSFVDVTSQLGLPNAEIRRPYTAGWAADLDMEGDLDLVLAAVDGPPVVLRNNGDATFSLWPRLQDVDALRELVWADLDADGDPDAAMVDGASRVVIAENLRSRGMASREVVAGGRALSTADLNTDGILELVVLMDDGRIERFQQSVGASAAEREELVTWGEMPAAADEVRLFVMDVDNNGALDLAASADSVTAIWLNDGQGAFRRLAAPANVAAVSLADVSGSGRLDIIGISDEERPVRLANRGSLNYHSKSIRPQAAETVGDQRINPFGLGGVIEVRSGALFQKQAITDPVVHFGLGENLVVDVARIVWPNGDVQAEFDLLSDETVQARQRLKGSCPWLFTFDGEEMTFVTDFIWRSPLGLRINAQETAGVMMTEDWVKIEGSELRPRDGIYDVRITADLWETHFFDHISLLVVDHPDTTEIFVDERFVFPPPALSIYSTGPRREIARAETGDGRDVTDIVRTKDERYHADIIRGPYQGIAEEHTLVVNLGEEARGSIYLLAEGWVRPTDSSINLAISQGTQDPPRGLRLEIPDGRGGWEVLHENLGFPAGKYKTMVIPLNDVFPPGAAKQVRLSTNLETYFDALWWAPALPDTDVRTARIDPAVADLRYRGFSVVRDEDRTRPEVPVYDSLQGSAQIWQDLEGYYTRFGDVRELLARVDDRYVIMNAGDEIAMQFDTLAAPPQGWVRDYVLIGDGWVKDGDYNTTFSETIRPLPSHASPDYSTPPGALEDDPVYQRYPRDWQEYHTRYVGRTQFRTGLLVR